MDTELMRREWEWAEEFCKTCGRPQRVFKADKKKTALVIVDMQNAFIKPAEHFGLSTARELVSSINILTRACRDANIPVIWVISKVKSKVEWGLTTKVQPDSCFNELVGWDTEGTKLWYKLEVDAEKDYEIVKCRYSAFISGSSNLERLLHNLGKDRLIMVGTASNVCVATTAMDAMMLDFKVILVSDATMGFTDFLHQATLMNFKMVFGDVVTTADILKELK